MKVIHAYTRAQALADGVLVDLSATARQVGFGLPLAMTSAAWSEAVEWPVDLGGAQTEASRAWDVVWLARNAACRYLESCRQEFSVDRVDRRTPDAGPTTVRLVVHIGPGDEGEPVLTIMLPTED